MFGPELLGDGVGGGESVAQVGDVVEPVRIVGRTVDRRELRVVIEVGRGGRFPRVSLRVGEHLPAIAVLAEGLRHHRV